jgi:carboxy-cis,cis-muconate cyclase
MSHVFAASLEAPRLATYDIINSSSLQLAGAAFSRGRCLNKTASYVLASKRFPHYVFSGSYPGPWACGMSSYTSPVGGLLDMASSWQYGFSSGVRGLAFGWGYGQVLYTADGDGDAIWTHSFGFYGETYFQGRYSVPTGLHPRHIVTHPFGKYLYASMEGGASVVPYVLDPYTSVVKRNESAVSLIPQGE